MGRATEYISSINMKVLPSSGDFIAICPSLGESDRILVKQIRADIRKKRRETRKERDA